jgi:serine protease Do
MKKALGLIIAIVLGLLGTKLCFDNTRIERVINASEPKVVKIGIVFDRTKGVCSGSFITPEGVVLTCAHCFQQGDGVKVKKVFIKTSDGTVYNGKLIKLDEEKDLALVELGLRDGYLPFIVPGGGSEPEPFPYFRLGETPKIGQQVISMGSPLGIQHTAGVGYVANLLERTYKFILHSAFVNPGNSGGPLVNLKGELIGVNEAMLSIDPFNLAHGLYLAVSAGTVKNFLNER